MTSDLSAAQQQMPVHVNTPDELAAATRAVLWQVDHASLSREDAHTVLRALALVDDEDKPSRAEIARANRRASMARLRAGKTQQGGAA